MIKKTIASLSLVFFAGTSLLADDSLPGPSTRDSKFKSPKHKTSYALGMDIGNKGLIDNIYTRNPSLLQ